MRGLMKAAALALASSVVSTAHPLTDVNSYPSGDILPHAFIDLDVSKVVEDVLIPRTLLAFDIFESKTSCDGANITIDGSELAEDEDGRGAGLITTRRGVQIDASWRFTCVQVDDNQKFEQILNLDIHQIDGYPVHNLNFTVQFQQRAPTGVSFVDGAFSVIRVPTTTRTPNDPDAPHDKPFNLQSELYALEIMKAHRAKVEFEIAMKELFILQAFPNAKLRLTSSVTDCTDLKCLVTTIVKKVKNVFTSDGTIETKTGLVVTPPDVLGDSGMAGTTESTSKDGVPQDLVGATTPKPIFKAPGTLAQAPLGVSETLSSSTEEGDSKESLFTTKEPWESSTALLTAKPLEILSIIGSGLLLVVVAFIALRAACSPEARRRRAARRARRKACAEKRQARINAMKAAYINMCAWWRTAHKPICDEEKQAAVEVPNRKGHEEHSIPSRPLLSLRTPAIPEVFAFPALIGPVSHQEPDSDNESTTMEQDLAHFRAVASVVEGLFTSAEDRIVRSIRRSSIGSHMWSRNSSTDRYSGPPSPTSTVPDYTSSDETLPSYEESSRDS